MHITYAMVRDEIPAIIETRGENFVYENHPGSGGTCMYAWEGKPDCLIGCYLTDLGFPIEAFAEFEGKSIDDVFSDEFPKKNNFTAEPEAIMAMAKLQHLQDNGYSWGDAYAGTFE